MKMTIEMLLEQSGSLFSKAAPFVSLCQILADNFYPESADFTLTRNIGDEFTDDLIDSFPILCRRDMGNSLSAMLRDGEWFESGCDVDPDYAGKMWLQWCTKRMRTFFNDHNSGFTRATKEGDHDYVTFGQTVISIEMNRQRSGLLFRKWHLRDCVWFEDEAGNVCGLHRRWKPNAYQLKRTFGDKIHAEVQQAIDNVKGETQFECLHLLIPSDQYGDETIDVERFPYVSIHIDKTHKHIMEAVPQRTFTYIVPRFHTVSGSQYAYSPATVVALPNARLIQAMTHTLLEAGERYARPPMVATQTVVRGDVDLSPDGITWVDKEYDQRFGAALAPLETQRGGFPIGLELREDVREVLRSAFFLDKINFPSVDHEMTAYEVAERMKQFRREVLPLLAPIESQYNGRLCEVAFNLLLWAGLLGSPYDIPDSIKGRNIVFKFKSPLTAADEEKKANHFAQVRTMLAEAAELDPMAMEEVNLSKALRDAVEGIGAPEEWLNAPEVVAQRVAMRNAALAQQAQQNPEALAKA